MLSHRAEPYTLIEYSPTWRQAPFPFSFQIYVTIDSPPSSLPVELLDRIIKEAFPHGDFRFDIHSLPGSSPTECIVHYHAEKESRKGNDLDQQILEHQIVEDYSSWGDYPYRSVLWIVDNENWENEGLTEVRFDRLAQGPEAEEPMYPEEVYIARGFSPEAVHEKMYTLSTRRDEIYAPI